MSVHKFIPSPWEISSIRLFIRRHSMPVSAGAPSDMRNLMAGLGKAGRKR